MERVRAYAIAVVAAAVAVYIPAAVPAYRGGTAFVLVLGGAIVASSLGGLGPGLVATVAGALAVDFFIIPPVYSAVQEKDDLLRLVLCLAVGGLASYYSGTFRRAVAQRELLLAHTEEARAAAEGANRAKDEFLALVSHELRSPLAAIRMWAGMLRTGRLGPDARERALRAIEDGTETEARLVGDLLDVSRIASGKLALDLRDVDVGDAVRAALDGSRAAADEKRIWLEERLEPAPVRGDSARLQQVAWNLITNAIKFTPEGGHVCVSLARNATTARLAVSDDGEGIEPDLLPHVFERFRQGTNAASPRLGGLGLGLAIVRHLVEEHGGTVVAHSAGRGRGATFVVTLPLHAPVERLVAGATPREIAHRLQGLDVLLVDDERASRDAIAAVLEGAGAHVRAATSTDDALARLDEHVPDVLVSDLAMPGDDGWALVRRLRERGVAVPAVAVTALAGPGDRRRAFAVGFQAHLAKPVDASELVEVVARLGATSSAA